MRCHYCSRDADYVAESEGVRVGLCTTHVRERVSELADEGAIGALQDVLDVEDR